MWRELVAWSRVAGAFRAKVESAPANHFDSKRNAESRQARRHCSLAESQKRPIPRGHYSSADIVCASAAAAHHSDYLLYSLACEVGVRPPREGRPMGYRGLIEYGGR